MATATRDVLLAAAARCFAGQGFHATSIGQIARQAGVSQGAMYNHFAGKTALIAALVSKVMEQAQKAYAQPTRGPVVDRLCELTRACIALRDYEIDAPLWVEILAETGRDESVRTAFVEADRNMRVAMANLIRAGLEAGEFDDIEPDEVTLIIFALVDGLIARRTMKPAFDVAAALPDFDEMLGRLLNARAPAALSIPQTKAGADQ